MAKIVKNNFWNFLVICLIFLMMTAWIFSSWPQIWRQPSVPPEVKKAEAAENKNFENKSINFSYTDDNSNENLIIKTDEKTYIGLTRADVYFSVTNINEESELVNIQVHFPEDKGEVTKIEKWTKDDWASIELSNDSLSIKQSFFEKIFGGGIEKKSVPGSFRVKRSTSQGYLINPSQTQYFKMEINFPISSSGEFYIEAIGDKEGYGLLDPWWSGGANWNYRKKLSFDNMNANSISTIADEFTILVKLTTSNFDYPHLGRTEQDGGDIRFVCKDDSTEITDWHIEEWDYNGTSSIWVEIPSDNDGTDAIKGDDSSYIYMYYGNADAPQKGYSDTDEQNTYDSHFKMVQHLEETTGTHYDSTSNNCDGTPKYGVVQDATGKMDGANDFDGTDDNVYCCTLSPVPTQYTTEAWIKGDTFTGTGDHSTYGFTIIATSNKYGIWLLAKGGEIRFYAFSGSTSTYGQTTTTPLTVDTWHYVTVTAIKDGGAAKIYVDGNEELSFTTSTQAWAGYITIGDLRDNRKIAFDGKIDEVRISDTVRSANWIKAQYFSTKDDFITYGTELSQGTPQCGTQDATSVEEATATLNGNVTEINDTSITERGFDWDIDSGSPYANNWTETGSWGAVSFNHGISGLTKGELYYFRAKAKNNDNNWGYGLELTFLTKPDEPTNLDAKNPTADSIELTWAKGTGAQKTMIRRKEGSYPTSYTDGAEAYFDTGTSTTDSGLESETTYYYRAWSYATEGGKTQYSDNYSEDTETTTAAPLWWNDSWSYRKKINFDKMTTNSISTISDEFTILVKFDSSFEYSHLGKSNGGDIRFVKKNNVTEIADWHIEKWNNGGDSWLWIEVPTDNDGTDAIKGDDSSYIYMYYGNAAASDKGYSDTDEQNTYDSHFKMVHHLEETPVGIDGTHYDSTSNNNEGTTKGGVTTDATGKIDGADDFDGTDDDIRMTDSESLHVSDELTVETWIYPNNAAGSWQTIIAHSPESGGIVYNYWLYLESNALKLSVYSTTYPGLTVSNVIPNSDTWYYVAFTAIKGSTMKIFVNGSQAGSDGTAGTSFKTDEPLTISDLRSDRNIRFDGTIDEVRISDTARSPNWVKAQYYSMMSDFFTFGSEEQKTISIIIITDKTVAFGVIAEGETQDTVTLADTQIAKNDGTAAENFKIKSTNATRDGGTDWVLGATAGGNIFTMKASLDGGSTWDVVMTTADTYVVLKNNVAVNETVDFDLQIGMPTSITDYLKHNITVTVMAEEAP